MSAKWRMSPAGMLLYGTISAYQRTVSPLLGPCCRFQPSCSQYALEAIRRHGVGRGVLLSLRRLVRCHPWGPAGYDPVPDHMTLRRCSSRPCSGQAGQASDDWHNDK